MLEIIQDLSKPRKSERKYKKGKKFSGRQVNLKTLVKSKTINKTDKNEYMDMLGSNIQNLKKEIFKYYSKGESKIFEDRSDLVDLFTNKKFVKYLCAVLEEIEDTPYEIFFVVGDMLINEDAALIDEEKICQKYFKLFNNFQGDKIKKIAKAFGCKKSDALVLLLIITKFKDARLKLMAKRYLKFLEQLYQLEELEERKVAKGLKVCFGEKLDEFISVALTEKPDTNNESFNVVTNAILSIINKMDMSDAKSILRDYSKKRAKYPNGKRRLNFFTINQDEYKTIFKAIDRLLDTGCRKETFL